MPEQTVFIHVGSSKTGSSYLQAALVAGQEALAARGIDFPLDARTRRRADMGRVVTGNVRPHDPMAATLARYPGSETRPRLLFSNETLFLTLTQPDSPIAASIRAAFPEARLEVLCYIRDPLDHAMSAYGQVVKRNGYTRDCATFLRRYDGPERVLRLSEVIDGIGGHLTILNYSRHRDDLLGTLEDWLGVDRGTIPVPERSRINRSLTRSELEIQRAFNRHLGQFSSVVVSEPLCDHLPDLRAEWPSLSRADLAAFLTRMEQVTGDPRLAALIPQAERFRVGTPEEHAARFPDPESQPDYRLTQDQIETLVGSISLAIKSHAPDLAARFKNGDQGGG